MFTDGRTDGHRTIALAHGLVGAYARGPAVSWAPRWADLCIARRQPRVRWADRQTRDRHATDTTYQPASQSDSTQLGNELTRPSTTE